MRFDLGVIGGGPAGLATAIDACLADLSVILFDRRQPPIEKACGEGLMPNGVQSLERLGVDARALGRPFAGIRYLSGETVAEGYFPSGSGVGIRRLRLHDALAKRAREVGVELRWNTPVEAIDEHRIRTRGGDFNCRWIVGADGLHSSVRRWIDVAIDRGRPRFGIRRHYRTTPWSDLVEVHWGEDCEAYVTPISDREVGVAVLRGAGKERFDQTLARFPTLAAHLSDFEHATEDRGLGPLWAVPRRVVSGHVALVGDAAGYLDAITGEGLSLGFRQAEALVGAIRRSDLRAYERSVHRLGRLPGALIKSLLFVERRPALVERLVRALASEPELFSRILGVHADQLPLRAVGLGGAGRLLRGFAGSI